MCSANGRSAYFFGPYLPDITGSIVCFCALLLLLKVWRPTRILGHGGIPVSAAELAAEADREHGLTGGEVLLAWMPFAVLVVVVAAWTGPWSSLPAVGWYFVQVQALAPETKATISAVFKFAPWVGGSAILASWLIVVALLTLAGKLRPSDIGGIFRKTFHQMWGALLVGVFIFGLAYVFNYSGMASSLAKGFSYLGTWFIVVAPILGFIGVALSGSNTSTNAMFGKFQALVGIQLGFAPLLLPTLNSVGCGDRQADRAADRQRGGFHQQVRAQRGRGDPPQLRLDAGSAGVSDRDRGWVLFRRSDGDAPAVTERGSPWPGPAPVMARVAGMQKWDAIGSDRTFPSDGASAIM